MTQNSHVILIDDDAAIRNALTRALSIRGYMVHAFESANVFLEQYDPELAGCMLVDIRMPGLSGLDLQDALRERGSILPIIFITGHGDVPESVRALKAGAVDFLQKPFQQEVLLTKLGEAFAVLRDRLEVQAHVSAARALYDTLTEREVEVFDLLVKGQPNCSNKDIARTLRISHRTVDHHRARIMQKMKARNIVELIELGNRLRSTS